MTKAINITQGIELYRVLKKLNKDDALRFKGAINKFYLNNEHSLDANESILGLLRAYLIKTVGKLLKDTNKKDGLLNRVLSKVSNNIEKKNELDFKKIVPTVQNVFKNSKVQEQLLDNYVAENLRLIKGLREESLEKAKSIVMGSIQSGQKRSFIINELKGLVDRSDKGYKLIARDQAAKLYSSITEVRAKNNGWQFYIWDTSEDIKVRSLSNSSGYQDHVKLDGKIFKFSDPPQDVFRGKQAGARHNPGFNYQCRCTARILFDPPEAFVKNGDGSYSYRK